MNRPGVAWVVSAVCLSALVWAPAVLAQGIDLTQGGPIQITSKDGIEWRQAEQVVIAKGDAKAVRGNVTVTADRLLAWYRKKANATTAQRVSATPPAPGQSPDANGGPAPGQPTTAGADDTEGNEVYRMRAEGNVYIYTDTDKAWSDQATYDLDQGVLVMTGHALRLTTPNDTLTARDTMEYWSLKHMAVARGDAVIVTSDARRVSADTLVAYTVEAPAAQTAGPPGAAPPAGKPSGAPAQAGGDPMAAMAGKLQRVEAFNHVTIRTVTDIVTGERAVYIPDTGIAHLGGHVRISRGLNQVEGSEAVVNMKTGVATLLAGDSGRVSGLMVPNDQSNPGVASDGQPKSSQQQPKSGNPRGPFRRSTC